MIKRLIALFFVFLIALLLWQQPAGAVEGVQLIVNDHAMGIDGTECPTTHDPTVEAAGAGWAYNQYMTLSKCGGKNSDGGAMFKNGPIAYSGQGLPGVPAVMWQDYDMAALGFDGSDITFDFQVELVSLGGTQFHAYLYSSADGVTFSNPVDLLNWPAGGIGTGSRFPVYAGGATLPYAPFFRLEIVSVWQSGIGSLGQKWANLSLLASDGGIVPTATNTLQATPTETGTAVPSATPTPPGVTATPSPFPGATATSEPTVTPGGDIPRWCRENPTWPGCEIYYP